MLGRKPLFAVLILLAVLVLERSAPFLAWVWHGGFHPTLDEIRDRRGIRPWDQQPEVPERKMNVTVFGAHTIEHFEEPYPPSAAGLLEPTVTVEAKATDTVKLAGGEELRLRAIQVFPQKRDGAREFLPVEKVFYDPSGAPMTREQAMQLNVISPRGTSDPALIWNNTTDDGLPWKVNYLVQTNLHPEDLVLYGVCDTQTGYLARRYLTRLPPPFVESEDEIKGLQLFSVGYDAVRPTPQTIRFQVRTGEATIIFLGPIAPQTFACLGRSCSLLDISRGRLQNFLCTFESLPVEMASLRAIGKGGRSFPQTARRRYGDRVQYDFYGSLDELESLVIRVKPSCAQVVMQLPDLPIVPAANRQTDDLMQMVVPPVIVRDEDKWKKLMGSILQLKYQTDPGVASGLWPQDLGGKRVADLLAIDAARHPGSEIVVRSSSTLSWLRWEPAGKTAAALAKPSPYSTLRRLALPVLALLALWKTVLLLRGAALRRAIRPRGYGDFTIWQAEFLAAKLGRRAWQLPPRDELAALPGVDMEDLRTVVALMRERAG